MTSVDLSIVVAMTPDRVIGFKGELPWGRLPSDMTRFRKKTMKAGIMVMGRRTLDSIIARNGKPLDGRIHIVLTRKEISSPYEEVLFVHSPEEALERIKLFGKKHACLIGGGEIFELFFSFPQLRSAHITTVYMPRVAGDAYFPLLTAEMGWWCKISSVKRKYDPRDEFETSFEEFSRSLR